MQKISNLKAQLGANVCLSADQTYKVKGGNTNTTTTTTTSTTTTSSTSNVQQTEDDKRRERPGGLTSQ